MSADRLFEYALDTLDAKERAALEVELSRSSALRAELEETRATLGLLPLALRAAAPPPALRDRLLASLDADPYAPFAAKLAALFDLGRGAMQAVLDRAKRAAEWEPAPFAGGRLFHFDGGPAMAAADCGLMELPPGFEHPYHEHVGFERSIVLAGSITDDDGAVYGPGDAIEKAPGSGHAYRVNPGERYVVALAISDVLHFFPEGKGGPFVVIGGNKHGGAA